VASGHRKIDDWNSEIVAVLRRGAAARSIEMRR